MNSSKIGSLISTLSLLEQDDELGRQILIEPYNHDAVEVVLTVGVNPVSAKIDGASQLAVPRRNFVVKCVEIKVIGLRPVRKEVCLDAVVEICESEGGSFRGQSVDFYGEDQEDAVRCGFDALDVQIADRQG